MEIELELGEFYTRVQDGFEPVVIWIGRVDLPDDLGVTAPEPIVSLILKSPMSDMPTLSFAAFWESVALDGDMQDADPFDVNETLFEENYNTWRDAFDRGEAFPWTKTPNEIYAQMCDELKEALQG